MKQIKFEWIFATLILLILTSMYFMSQIEDIKLQIAMALISAFSASIGYIFGKSTPDK